MGAESVSKVSQGSGLPETLAWITFITGGARSGKSRFAQEQALRLSDNPVYVATAKRDPADLEFSARISRHEADRDRRWTSLEEPLYVSRLALEGRLVVVDCITLWLSNFFSLTNADEEISLAMIKEEIEKLRRINARLLFVSNEIGMGVHADSEIGRRFTDLQGWTNQYIAGIADEVVFMVSGIPMIIKTDTRSPKYF
jgi:adenosylcobinamide kinase/adenosylcobinamide-phosphate guanylyltransferase